MKVLVYQKRSSGSVVALAVGGGEERTTEEERLAPFCELGPDKGKHPDKKRQRTVITKEIFILSIVKKA